MSIPVSCSPANPKAGEPLWLGAFPTAGIGSSTSGVSAGDPSGRALEYWLGRLGQRQMAVNHGRERYPRRVVPAEEWKSKLRNCTRSPRPSARTESASLHMSHRPGAQPAKSQSGINPSAEGQFSAETVLLMCLPRTSAVGATCRSCAIGTPLIGGRPIRTFVACP